MNKYRFLHEASTKLLIEHLREVENFVMEIISRYFKEQNYNTFIINKCYFNSEETDKYFDKGLLAFNINYSDKENNIESDNALVYVPLKMINKVDTDYKKYDMNIFPILD